jgi:hypothetical protein
VTFNRRIAGIAAGTAGAIVLITWYVMSWVTSFPPTVQAGTTAGVTNVTFQTVASYGHQPHPDWVSYLVKNAQGEWVHSTVVQVPAHSLIRFTVYNYDGASGLRNPLWSQPRGTVGGTETIDGKPVVSINPDDTSHTFAIPDLGVSVAIPGVGDDAPNQCTVTPCQLSMAHHTITFTIRTGKPGHYRWQCFVPCAAGWIDGFGGPMQTIGYMDGFLNVKAA